MNAMSKWLVIVNPNAGTRKGIRDWKEISQLLTKSAIEFEHVFTEGIGHAIKITTDCIREGYRRIIVVGGDGTLNEVINGIFRQQEVPGTEFVVGTKTGMNSSPARVAALKRLSPVISWYFPSPRSRTVTG